VEENADCQPNVYGKTNLCLLRDAMGKGTYFVCEPIALEIRQNE
jgi:hypothetical protein